MCSAINLNTRHRYVRVNMPLQVGVRHRLLLSNANGVLRVFLDDVPRSAARLAATVADCGSRSESCVLQIGSTPQTSLAAAGGFFRGDIHALSFHSDALLDYPPTPRPVNAALSLLPVAFSSGRTCLQYSGNATSALVSGALPFRSYLFQLTATNSAGSASSAIVLHDTRPGLPQGLSELNITNIGPTSVTLSWSPPTHANAVLIRYDVEMLHSGTQWFVNPKIFCCFISETTLT